MENYNFQNLGKMTHLENVMEIQNGKLLLQEYIKFKKGIKKK